MQANASEVREQNMMSGMMMIWEDALRLAAETFQKKVMKVDLLVFLPSATISKSPKGKALPILM